MAVARLCPLIATPVVAESMNESVFSGPNGSAPGGYWAAEGMVAGLKSPALPVSLRAALLEIPRKTVSCEGAERLLPLAIENEISDDEERRLSSHLSRCAGCSEAAATLAAARDLAARLGRNRDRRCLSLRAGIGQRRP